MILTGRTRQNRYKRFFACKSLGLNLRWFFFTLITWPEISYKNCSKLIYYCILSQDSYAKNCLSIPCFVLLKHVLLRWPIQKKWSKGDFTELWMWNKFLQKHIMWSSSGVETKTWPFVEIISNKDILIYAPKASEFKKHIKFIINYPTKHTKHWNFSLFFSLLK